MMPSQFCADDVIACIFPGALGDFLCFSEALAGLRRVSAGRIRVVARGEWLDLLPPLGFERFSIDGRGIAQLFGSGPLDVARRLFGDAVVYSWTGHGSSVAQRLTEAGARAVRVFPFRAFAHSEHASDYYARCLGVRPQRVVVNVDEAASAWSLEALRPVPAPRAALHPGSGSPRKNWRGFPEVALRLRAAGYGVVELRGPAEDGAPPLEAVHLTVREPLARVVAVLRTAALYVGNDSGITHLAAALDIPGLALFGEGSAVHWAPRAPSLRVVEALGSCERCPHDAFCIHRLPPDRVEAALREVTRATVA